MRYGSFVKRVELSVLLEGEELTPESVNASDWFEILLALEQAARQIGDDHDRAVFSPIGIERGSIAVPVMVTYETAECFKTKSWPDSAQPHLNAAVKAARKRGWDISLGTGEWTLCSAEFERDNPVETALTIEYDGILKLVRVHGDTGYLRFENGNSTIKGTAAAELVEGLVIKQLYRVRGEATLNLEAEVTKIRVKSIVSAVAPGSPRSLRSLAYEGVDAAAYVERLRGGGD